MTGLGVGALQIIPQVLGGVSGTGGLFALIVSAGTVDQQLTNVDTTVNFDTDSVSAFGPIRRVGNVFTIDAPGTYLAIYEPQVLQQKNNNVTSAWVVKNGVAVPGSASIFEAAAIGDNNVLSVTFAGNVAQGDQFTFHATTSQSVGSSLNAIPPAPPVPQVVAVQVIILGFKTGSSPF
jgi:hypothetical protein